jgi:hypothetical protein
VRVPSQGPVSDPPLIGGRSNLGWIRQSAADRAAQDDDHDDPAIDMDENELHAGAGELCSVCHRAIEGGQAVRLRADGTYQHDTCPPG